MVKGENSLHIDRYFNKLLKIIANPKSKDNEQYL